MITRFLWAELLIELAVSTLMIGLLRQHINHIMLVCLPLIAFVVIRIVAVLIISVVLWRLRDELAPPLSAVNRARLIWREALALIRIYFLMLSEFRSTGLPLPPRETSFIVVLLHGVYCNRGIWRPWLRRFTAHQSCVLLAPNLEPVMGSLDVQASGFARWFNQVMRTQSRQKIILVGFSMGGLIARICIERNLLNASIHKLICIGTPHAGSRVANYAPGKVGRDLRINSNALSSLKNVRTEAATKIINLYSRHDTLVVPCQNACLPRAINDGVDGVGHLSLLYSPDVQASVLRELRTS